MDGPEDTYAVVKYESNRKTRLVNSTSAETVRAAIKAICVLVVRDDTWKARKTSEDSPERRNCNRNHHLFSYRVQRHYAFNEPYVGAAVAALIVSSRQCLNSASFEC